MERTINRIKLFVNENEESLTLKRKVEDCFQKYHFEIVEEDYEKEAFAFRENSIEG